MDTSKHFFQLHGVNAAEEPVLRKKLRRKDMVAFFERLAPTVIAIEACGGSHHWARLLSSFGHRGEVDRTSAGQTVRQARQERCGGRRSALRGDEPADDAVRAGEDSRAAGSGNARRRTRSADPQSYAAGQLHPRLCVGIRPDCRQGNGSPRSAARAHSSRREPADSARELFAAQAKEYEQLQAQIDEVDVKLKAWHHADECGRRLAQIPRRRSNRRGAADDENPSARDVPIRPAIRSLDRLDAEGSFYRRQGQARRHHASRRRGFAQRIGGGSDSASQVCSKRQKQKCALALARAASEAKASETGRRGAGQQACSHRLEADGHRPKLRPEIHPHHRGGSGLRISQPRGAHQMQPC